MRITSGIYKGRGVIFPKGIRPTQNKVRKALFDILNDIEGLSFLELFSGSGAVGFEALSRGAAHLTLVEENKNSISAIKENIEALKLTDCSLLAIDANKATEFLKKQGKEFDLIFLDPPYHGRKDMGESAAKKTLQNLSRYDILAPNGFIIVQHSKKDNLPETQGGLILFKQANYGDTILSFYRKNTRKQ